MIAEEQNEAKVNEVTKMEIIPVFIGTELTDLVGLIDEIVKEKFPEHTVAVLSPQLYVDLAYKYALQGKSTETKEAIVAAQKNEAMQEQAMDVAMRIVKLMNVPKYFTIQQLRKAYRQQNKKVSHKQIDEIVNFLGAYGFMKPVDNNINHKTRYEIILSREDDIKHIEVRNSGIKLKLQELNKELQTNEVEIAAIKREIAPASPKPKKVKSASAKTHKPNDESNSSATNTIS